MNTMTHRLIHFTAAACAVLTLAGTAEAIDKRSWDRKINDVTQRFVVLAAFNNQAVLDKETQLVWERSPSSSTFSWNSAFVACIPKSTGGRRGWRLPAAEELTSLHIVSTLPEGHPFQNAQYDGFWTATSYPGLDAALAVLGSGAEVFHSKSALHRAWCVRGGRGYDGS